MLSSRCALVGACRQQRVRFPGRWTLTAAVVMAAVPRGAVAHHGQAVVPREVTADSRGGRGELSLETSATRYLSDRSAGMALTLALDAQWRLAAWLELRSHVPTYVVDADDANRQMGMGDVAFGARALWPPIARWQLSAGLDVQLPTGDAGRGLGFGTVALVPFAHASIDVAPRWRVWATCGAIVDVMEAESTGAQVIVEQRGELELRGSVGGGFRARRWAMRAEVRAATPLGNDPNAGEWYVSVAPKLGYDISSRWRVSALAELPLVATRRLDWRAGVGWSFSWGSDDALPTPADS